MFHNLFWCSVFYTLILAAITEASNVRPRAPYHRPTDQRLVDREYVVMLREHHTLEQHFKVINTNVTAEAPFFRQIHTLPGYRAELDDDLLETIRLDPGVERVVHDTYVDHDLDLESTPSPDVDDDEDKESDEGARIIRRWTKSRQANAPFNLAQLSAFGSLTGSENPPAPYEYISDVGSGVMAYVLDTGINIEHTEFGGRARNFQGRTQTKYCRTPQSVRDINGHGERFDSSLMLKYVVDSHVSGTHVAGIIGGTTYGVAKSVNIRNVPVLCLDRSHTLGAWAEAISDVTLDHVSRQIEEFPETRLYD
jgi:hypothetical protein